MTDEQRKSVAFEYLKAFDRGGVVSTGESILELFAADAQVSFPKWGLATGKEQIGPEWGAGRAKRERWLRKLDQLRARGSTGKTGKPLLRGPSLTWHEV